MRFHPFKNILLSASYDNTSVVTEFDTQGFYLSSSLQTSCYEKHKFLLNVKLTKLLLLFLNIPLVTLTYFICSCHKFSNNSQLTFSIQP